MPVPSQPAPTARSSMTDEVYGQLLDAILTGELAPGRRLVDAELTGWLGVSRTPVRQAIEKLADEGFVELQANRYTRVASFDERTFLETGRVILALHQRAVSRMLPGADDSTVAAVSRLVTDARRSLRADDGGLPSTKTLRALRDLTGYFTRRSTNPLVRKTVSGLEAQMTFLTQAVARPLDEAAVGRFLDAFAAGVEDRDPDAVDAALSRLVDEDLRRLAERAADEAPEPAPVG